MFCQHCKKNIATVNYVEIVNGERFESHLCPFCYASLTGELNSKVNADLWAGLFGTSAPKRKICEVCGTSYDDYERTGLLGCANCYAVFKEELMPSIDRIQGKVQHIGKVAKNGDGTGIQRRLKDLQEQLECALREKRFEDAGRLNKEISKLTKTLYGGDDGEL